MPGGIGGHPHREDALQGAGNHSAGRLKSEWVNQSRENGGVVSCVRARVEGFVSPVAGVVFRLTRAREGGGTLKNHPFPQDWEQLGT